MAKTKFILIGGYPWKTADGGKAFAEELVKGFKEPVKVLECLFARPRQDWTKAYDDDQNFFANHLPDKQLRFQLADPEKFAEQVRWADAIYIRGGSSEAIAGELLKQGGDWKKELEEKTLAGTSAGADLIATYYYDLDNLKISQGLGLLPVKALVHYRSDYNSPNIDWDKTYEALMDYKEDLPIITLAEGQFVVRETRTRIVGMIIQDGKLLMLRGYGRPELWTPGGKIEKGESDLECLKRELKEELGVEFIEAEFFKEYTGPSYYEPDKYITHQRVYIAQIKGVPTPAAEIDECIWLTKDNFKKGTYTIITTTKNEIIPDLIKAGIW